VSGDYQADRFDAAVRSADAARATFADALADLRAAENELRVAGAALAERVRIGVPHERAVQLMLDGGRRS